MPTTPPLPDEPGYGEGQLQPIERPAAAAPQPARQPQAAPEAQQAPVQAQAQRPAVGQGRPVVAAGRRHAAPAVVPHLASGATTAPRINAATGSQAPSSAADVAAPGREPLHEPFTESQLNLMWDAYIRANPTAHILVNTMRTSRPKLVDKARFVVTVENDKQVETMNDASLSLVGYLREKLKNDEITFEVVVNDGESSPRTWNSREVYQHILETCPAVKTFAEEFKLNLV